MRFLKSIILVSFFALPAFSQETKDKSQELSDQSDKMQTSTDTSSKPWKLNGTVTLATQQVSLTNWAAGGQSSISASGLVNFYAGYHHKYLIWDNNCDLAYGSIKQGSNRSWWKTDDRIQITSKVGHYAFRNAYYSALVDFKSQFGPGYNYPNDSVKISNFMAPGYLIGAVGMDFKPSSYVSFFVAPATIRMTFVLDDTLAKYGAFGVQKQVVDTATHLITQHYQKMREQFGGYFKMLFKKEVMQNVTFSTMLELFSDYLHNPQNLYVNWTTLTSMKVNKYISATLSTQMIYDDAVMIKDKDGKVGPRLQFKQVLGIGFSYKF
jgi:hypothetical protein